MATPLPTDRDTIVITSATSSVAPSDLATVVATIQVAIATSRKHAVTIEAMSKQEQAAMAAAATTTSGAATGLADLFATITALQALVATAEAKAEAQQARDATVDLEL
jgi:hypothetical protein